MQRQSSLEGKIQYFLVNGPAIPKDSHTFQSSLGSSSVMTFPFFFLYHVLLRTQPLSIQQRLLNCYKNVQSIVVRATQTFLRRNRVENSKFPGNTPEIRNCENFHEFQQLNILQVKFYSFRGSEIIWIQRTHALYYLMTIRNIKYYCYKGG